MSCKDDASKSNDDGVCDVNDMLQNMNTSDNNSASVCANCGKEGNIDEINNTCNKCKLVKYCNAACKKKHRKKHKKECEEHIRLAAELHDIDLFKQPPPAEDCPICFLRIPDLFSGWRYQACCGKVICSGCFYAPVYDNQGNKVKRKCSFCRVPIAKSEKEACQIVNKRAEVGDPIAIYNVGNFYTDGSWGFPQDHTKAIELWRKAGELGYAKAYGNIGHFYEVGSKEIEVDMNKAKYYFELAARGGDIKARHNLGHMEGRKGDRVRALMHLMIAVKGGNNESLKRIKDLYSNGFATKEEYTKALQSYQEYLGAITSVQRDKAAAADDDYRYY